VSFRPAVRAVFWLKIEFWVWKTKMLTCHPISQSVAFVTPETHY